MMTRGVRHGRLEHGAAQRTSWRVGIDGEALKNPLSGVGKYVFHLCRELDQLLPEAEFFAYSRLAPERLALPSQRWRVRREARPLLRRLPSFVWLKTRGAALCVADDLDVFWAGRTLHPRLGESVRTVSTVHDLNHRLVPGTMQCSTRWSHRLWFDRDVALADCVVTNSYGTRARLTQLLGVAATGVVWPGIDAAFATHTLEARPEAAESLRQLGIRPPYLLGVATLEPRKNVDVLFRAFLGLKRAGQLPGYQLVIVGARGWQNRRLERALLDARAEGVLLPGYVPDDCMPALYRAAEALVFPSLYEGFGMPVLEARACGTRVVISDLPELCEAAGPDAVRVTPSIDGVRAGILEALGSPRPSEPGLFERHSWRKGAQRFVPLLHGEPYHLSGPQPALDHETRVRRERQELLGT